MAIFDQKINVGQLNAFDVIICAKYKFPTSSSPYYAYYDLINHVWYDRQSDPGNVYANTFKTE